MSRPETSPRSTVFLVLGALVLVLLLLRILWPLARVVTGAAYRAVRGVVPTLTADILPEPLECKVRGLWRATGRYRRIGRPGGSSLDAKIGRRVAADTALRASGRPARRTF